MPTAAQNSEPLAPGVDVPPWPLIHFDVHCARCGHDLRGQREPVCPACGLAFRWELAVPLEHLTCSKCGYHLYGLSSDRCPECGKAVDWNEALLRYRRREKPHFEYRWRDRPIRSFIRTWLLALRPKRLWQTIDIHDPPRLMPLLLWAAIILLISDLMVPLIVATTHWVEMWLSARSRWRYKYWLEFPAYAVSYVTRFQWHFPLILWAWWSLLTLCALMIFRQSMRLCQVRALHVVRVWAYSAFAFMPLAVLAYLAVYSLNYILSNTGTWQRRASLTWLYDTYFCFGVAGMSHFAWSIRQGYRYYLRIPHSVGIAIVSQVIAALGSAITYARVLIH